MTKIKVLDAEVVKRIAAGETLQRPVNAVKELIENSLDAGADRISIFVQVPSNSTSSTSTETSAGLFSIQVIDNGSGIDKDDLALLCERHATSKLVDVSDLTRVGTFGFRGEALASCSQVARVEIVTRSREEESEVAWKASYTAGKLTEEPTPMAGNYGTIINVKDLFYGNRVRREALQNSSDEYQKIIQVIQAYALNRAGRCAFSLSRRRDRFEIQTSTGDDHVTIIKNLWNEELGAAMLPFKIECDPGLGIEPGSGGWATRTTFHKLKNPLVIIFLNDRLIEHSTLRRSILQSFSQHLPTSPPAHPFIYLNLKLKGSRVDVNVHPSKRQVFFMDEAEVVQRVVSSLDEGILRRQYETQTLKPILVTNVTKQQQQQQQQQCVDDTPPVDQVAKKPKPSVQKISSLYPSQRVLTDSANHRIDAFLYRAASQPTENGGWSPIERKNEKENDARVSEKVKGDLKNGKENTKLSEKVVNDDFFKEESKIMERPLMEPEGTTKVKYESQESEKSILLDSSQSERSILLNSSQSQPQKVLQPSQLSELEEFVTSRSNAQLSSLLQNSLAVGLIDSRWSLLQSGTNLLLCDTPRLTYELFFSLLARGGKAGRVFEVDLELRKVFAGEEDEEGVWREAEEVIKEQMGYLADGFGVLFETTDDGRLKLTELPVILPGQRCPSPDSLNVFLPRLALLDYSDRPAVRVASELAQLYSQFDWPDWEEYVRHVLLGSMRDTRARFTMRDEFLLTSDEEMSALPPLQIITNTETLYKSFERC